MEVHDKPKVQSRFLGIFMLITAAYYLAGWLREPDEQLYRLMAGIAFALITPHTILHPSRLSGS